MPKSPKRGTPNILILAPTRELACQIDEECVRFGKSSDIRSTCIYGGVPKSPQIRKIQGGIEVLVATPGRLNDILDVNAVDLSRIEFLGETLPLITVLQKELILCYLGFVTVLQLRRNTCLMNVSISIPLLLHFVLSFLTQFLPSLLFFSSTHFFSLN
jgi:DEAD/DEAH box helicase